MVEGHVQEAEKEVMSIVTESRTRRKKRYLGAVSLSKGRSLTQTYRQHTEKELVSAGTALLNLLRIPDQTLPRERRVEMILAQVLALFPWTRIGQAKVVASRIDDLT